MYPMLEEHANLARLVGEFVDDEGVTQTKVNKWNLVFDFTTNASGKENFKLIKPDKFKVQRPDYLLPDHPVTHG